MRIVQRLSDQSSSKSCSSQSSISSDTQSDFFPDGKNYFSLAPSHPVSENVLANAKGWMWKLGNRAISLACLWQGKLYWNWKFIWNFSRIRKVTKKRCTTNFLSPPILYENCKHQRDFFLYWKRSMKTKLKIKSNHVLLTHACPIFYTLSYLTYSPLYPCKVRARRVTSINHKLTEKGNNFSGVTQSSTL